jgi:hypothetical protein
MPTRNHHIAAQQGPVTLDVTLPTGAVSVIIEDRQTAEVTISTQDDAGPSADAVNNVAIDGGGGRLTVRLPRPTGGTVIQTGGHGTTMINSDGGVFVAGSNYGSVVQSGRGVWVDGGQIHGGALMVGSSPIVVEARLPLGSSLSANTTSADISAAGPLVAAHIRSVSGDVTLSDVERPYVQTTSGDIEIRALSGNADLAAVSGDIRVHAIRPCAVRANTVSGDVRVTGARVDLDAGSVSGRVRQS